jgi:hypothetical protein
MAKGKRILFIKMAKDFDRFNATQFEMDLFTVKITFGDGVVHYDENPHGSTNILTLTIAERLINM